MNQLFRPSPSAGFMVQRMPASIRATFTRDQLQAIESALVVRPHALDLRISLPWFGRGGYLVLIAGVALAARGRSARATNQLLKSFPHASHLLETMSKAVAASFTPDQIKAMDRTLVPRTHPIDLRSSVLIFGREFYAACIAGSNLRTIYRYHNLQNRNPFVIPIACVSVAVSAITLLALVHLRSSPLLAEFDPLMSTESTFHPTAVPFKKNREDCEKSDRQWIEEQCIDIVHDPTF